MIRTPANKGTIHNPRYAARLRLFDGLSWGNKTPTDVDCLVDFGGKAFVFVETKYAGAAIPEGQRLALEHVQDAITSTGRPCLLVWASHGDVDHIVVADCPVVAYRHGRAWRERRELITVRQIIDEFLDLHRVKR